MSTEQPQSRRKTAAKDTQGGTPTSVGPASVEETGTVDLDVAEGAVAPGEAPTQPRPTDANGYQLDADGLPLVGPARARVLAARAANEGQLDGAIGALLGTGQGA